MQIAEIGESLKDKGALTLCAKCSNADHIILANPNKPGEMLKIHFESSQGYFIPVVGCCCKKCGYLTFHSVAAFDKTATPQIEEGACSC